MAFKRNICIKTKLYVLVLGITKFAINLEKRIPSQNKEEDMMM
jgi:hypothetical protein